MSRIKASAEPYLRCGSLCIAVRHKTSRSAQAVLLACFYSDAYSKGFMPYI